MKKILFLLFLVWVFPVFAQDLSKMDEHNFKNYKCDFNIDDEAYIENLLSFPEYKGKDGLLCVHNTGSLESTAYVPLKKGVVDGKVVIYKGGSMYILSVWDVKKGVIDGMYKTYYENGQLEEEGYVKGSDQDGKWTKYYDDGRIKYISYYDKGRNTKEESYKYDDNGKLLEIKTYRFN